MKRLLLVAAALVGLAGCASTPDGQDKERFAVETGIVLVLENSSQPAQRAAEIVDTIDKLQNMLTQEQTTVGDLRSALLKRIGERSLSPGEKALALQVAGRIAEQIETRVGKGYMSADSVISIDRVLGWAENMAALYVSD
jgi:hypothetical protein